MSDDIVKRLRKEISKRDRPYPVELLPELREAADEIERLRRNTGCARNQGATQFCAEALDAQRGFETLQAQLGKNAIALAATIRELRKVETECSMLRVECGVIAAERDEARRWICEQKASWSDREAKWWAEVHTWDCFKDKAACCSTPADGKHTFAGETKVCGLCDQPSDAVNGHGDCMNCAKDQYGA